MKPKAASVKIKITKSLARLRKKRTKITSTQMKEGTSVQNLKL